MADAETCFLVQVKTNAPVNRIVQYQATDNLLRVDVKAPPQQGKANQALVAVLADFFGVSRGQIRLKVGHKTKRKLICISGITIKYLRKQLLEYIKN